MQKQTNFLLLHACCAPCALVPLEILQAQDYIPLIYFYNPNIHPQDEYERRLSTLQSFLANKDISLKVDTYEPELWEERVGIWGGPYPLIKDSSNFLSMRAAREKRCSACYTLRFERLASAARICGIEKIASTLSISPFQLTEKIQITLQKVAASRHITALTRDWRDLYALSTKKSRELGLYRQNYCGCYFSKLEAELERQAHKKAKANKRIEKHENRSL